MSHTAKPWNVNRECSRVVASGGPVAVVLKWPNILRHVSNARLIAAAPDLLEALHKTVDVVEQNVALIIESHCTKGDWGAYDISTLDEEAKPDLERLTRVLVAARKALEKAGA